MAIALDSSGNSGALINQTSHSAAFVNTAGNILIIGIAIRDDSNPAFAVTYNSVSMTSGADKTIGPGTAILEAQLFYLVNPATGSNTVSITWGGGSLEQLCVAYMSFSGVDTAAPIDATGTNGESPGTLDPRITNITTVAANAMLVDVTYDRSSPPTPANAGQTEIMNVGPNGGGDTGGASYKLATTAGAYTMGWNPPDATQKLEDWAHSVISLKPSIASTTGKFMTTRTKFF